MRAACLLAATVALQPLQASAAHGAGNDWVAYRDAYRAMVVFEKYGGPKSLLQQHLQILPRVPGADLAGVQVAVLGKTSMLNLPLDPTLRTVFPLTKAAYDENAVVQLTRPIGPFTTRPQVTIALRPDNLYDSEELRRACEQALAFARRVALLGARQCAGVRFVFDRGAGAAPLHLRAGPEMALPAVPGAAFAGDLERDFPVVTYRFGAGVHGHLATTSVPLAITPLFE